MRIGVFSVLFQDLPFEQALDKVVDFGLTAVEIGSGGYPGSHHCRSCQISKSQTFSGSSAFSFKQQEAGIG